VIYIPITEYVCDECKKLFKDVDKKGVYPQLGYFA